MLFPKFQELPFYIRREPEAILLSLPSHLFQLYSGPISLYFLKRYHPEPHGQLWLEFLSQPWTTDPDYRVFFYWFLVFQFYPSVRLEHINVNVNLESFLLRFKSNQELWNTMLKPLLSESETSMMSITQRTEDNPLNSGELQIEAPSIYSCLASLLLSHPHYFVPGEFVTLSETRGEEEEDKEYVIDGRRGWKKITPEEAHWLYEHGTNLNVAMWMVGGNLVSFDATNKGTLTKFNQEWVPCQLPENGQTMLSFNILNFEQRRDFIFPKEDSPSEPKEDRVAFFAQALEHLFTFGPIYRERVSGQQKFIDGVEKCPLFCRGIRISDFSMSIVNRNKVMFAPWRSLECLNPTKRPFLVIPQTLIDKCKWADYFQEACRVDELTSEDDMRFTWLKELDIRTLGVWAPITDIQAVSLNETCLDRHLESKLPIRNPPFIVPRGHCSIGDSIGRSLTPTLELSMGMELGREEEENWRGCRMCGTHSKMMPCHCRTCMDVRTFRIVNWASDVRLIPQIPHRDLHSPEYQRFLYVDGRSHWTRTPPCVHYILPNHLPPEFLAFLSRSSTAFAPLRH